MALALVKVKLMPDSPNVNLDEIEKKAKDIIKKDNIKVEKEPIAFGLTALIILFGWNEEDSTDELMEKLQDLEDVSSAEIIDFRRAIG